MSKINDSINMIYDIDNQVLKEEAIQKIQPGVSIAKVVLKNKEKYDQSTLSSLALYLSCTNEPDSYIYSDALDKNANLDFNKIYQEVKEQLKLDQEMLGQYYESKPLESKHL